MLTIGTELGGYRIEGVLGRGGMGVVYEAVQLSLDRTVALKLLSAELSSDSGFRERFRREGRLQASIDHPNIVTVLEAGEIEGHLFLAMQLVRGSTLREAIETGRLDPERTVRLLRGAAAALDEAHGAGLIHRDVKPSNVLIDRRDHPYLADFGLIKAPGEASLTKTGHFMGTVSYIAPEQIMGEDASAASDVYSLSCVLFECLTGRVPYPRPNEAAAIHAHMSEPPPRLTDAAPDLPAQLDEVTASGMAKEPAERPATAGALIDAAARAMAGGGGGPAPRPSPGGESTTIPVPSPRAPVAEAPTEVIPRRPASRRRLIAGGVATVALVAAVTAIIAGGDPDSGGGRPLSLGSGLGIEADSATCSGDDQPEACTLAQTALSGTHLEAPANGRITQWTLERAEGTFALLTLGPDYRVSARSEPEEVSGTATFDADLPIVEGGRVALEVGTGAEFQIAFLEGARLARWSPPLGEGEQRDATSSDLDNDYELLLSAQFVPDG